MNISGILVAGVCSLGIVVILILLWYSEAGFRAFKRGSAYFCSGSFHMKEEDEGIPGHRGIAWKPTKTKYGWVWLDYIWKAE